MPARRMWGWGGHGWAGIKCWRTLLFACGKSIACAHLHHSVDDRSRADTRTTRSTTDHMQTGGYVLPG
eukprot:7391823-Prymnesium_polylepis.2